LDEPTTGLHFDDINKLMNVLNRLVDQGNSVIIVEHNLEVIRAVDWVIDLGPEAGRDGGNLVFEGSPQSMIDYARESSAKGAPAGRFPSYTGEALALWDSIRRGELQTVKETTARPTARPAANKPANKVGNKPAQKAAQKPGKISAKAKTTKKHP
jgi:excinuclease ABC subunit A